MDLSSNRAAQTFLCRELQNLEILQRPEGKESSMAASLPSSMNFLCRWSESQKSQRVREEITRQHCICKSERDWCVALCSDTDWQPCLKFLQKEGKSACGPEVTDYTVYKIKETGSSLFLELEEESSCSWSAPLQQIGGFGYVCRLHTQSLTNPN